MIIYHAIAKIQSEGRVQIQGVGVAQPYSGVHNVRVPVNDKMELVVWWPQRLDTALELSHANSYAESLRDGFKD